MMTVFYLYIKALIGTLTVKIIIIITSLIGALTTKIIIIIIATRIL